jgi:O-6-methylguanine DNA methyltransferase
MRGSARGSHSEFRSRVLRAVRSIPVGRVSTYGDVARLAGRPRAWRAVGTIMRTCNEPGVPCHRVIGSGGRLGGYGGNEAMKRALLQAEGLTLVNGRVRQFSLLRWQKGDSHTSGAKRGTVTLSPAGKRGTAPLSAAKKVRKV